MSTNSFGKNPSVLQVSDGPPCSGAGLGESVFRSVCRGSCAARPDLKLCPLFPHSFFIEEIGPFVSHVLNLVHCVPVELKSPDSCWLEERPFCFSLSGPQPFPPLARARPVPPSSLRPSALLARRPSVGRGVRCRQGRRGPQLGLPAHALRRAGGGFWQGLLCTR